MVIYKYKITLDKISEVWQLIPLFDVHSGNVDCDLTQLRKDLKKKVNKHTLIIGGGDLLDSIITSDIKRYRKSADNTVGDAIIDEQIDIMYDILKPYASHIIGLGEGNHEDSILKYCGTNPIKRLCKILSTDEHTVLYLGYSSLGRLVFKAKSGTTRTLTVRLHHGWGGGSRTRGADITKYEKDMGKWDADVYLYGHVHKSQADKTPRLGLQSNGAGVKLISRKQLLVIAGTYLKTYSSTEDPTYSEKKGYPAAEIGMTQIFMKCDSHKWMDLWTII